MNREKANRVNNNMLKSLKVNGWPADPVLDLEQKYLRNINYCFLVIYIVFISTRVACC